MSKEDETPMFKARHGLNKDGSVDPRYNSFTCQPPIGRSIRSVDQSVETDVRSVSVWLTPEEWAIIQEMRKS